MLRSKPGPYPPKQRADLDMPKVLLILPAQPSVTWTFGWTIRKPFHGLHAAIINNLDKFKFQISPA